MASGARAGFERDSTWGVRKGRSIMALRICCCFVVHTQHQGSAVGVGHRGQFIGEAVGMRFKALSIVLERLFFYTISL